MIRRAMMLEVVSATGGRVQIREGDEGTVVVRNSADENEVYSVEQAGELATALRRVARAAAVANGTAVPRKRKAKGGEGE
jgi:hypothetical protein